MIFSRKKKSACSLAFITAVLTGTLPLAWARSEPLKATVSETQETDKLEGLGIKSVIHIGTDKKQTIFVDTVRMGSKAFYKGVEVGDIVRGMAQKGDMFCLSIERKGTPYQINFRGTPLQPVLDPTTGTPTLTITPGSRDIPQLLVNQKKRREEILAKYNIELIIDISGSMTEVDGTDGMSKFEWCHQQVSTLAQKLAPYLKSMTITTYNTQFTTEENCSVDRVEQIYADTKPVGGTDLVDPLSDRLEKAGSELKSHPDRKVLIAVITDGLPNVPKDPHVVNQAINTFTQTLRNPDQVLLTFLQIGDTFDGQSFCKQLDDDLVGEGAKYDIVATQTFGQLKQRGLADALIDCIVNEKMSRSPGSERADIERQLLGR